MDDLKLEIEKIINYFNSGRFLEGEIKIKILLKKYPTVAYLHNLLGLLLKNQNKIVEAEKSFAEAIVMNPKFGMAYNNLGNICYKKDNKKAKEYYEKALKLEPKSVEILNNLANYFKKNNKIEESIKYFNQSLEINSSHPLTNHNLGMTYQAKGDFKKAEEYLLKAINLKPDFYLAHLNLSINKKYHINDSHLNQMEEINTNKKMSQKEKFYLFFGLGKAYEDIYEYKKAFQFFNLANLEKRKTIKFDIKKQKENFKNIKTTFTKEIFKMNATKTSSEKVPIFILGMPRSGTTLVEQIISNHNSVFGAGELHDLQNICSKYFSIKDGFLDFPKNLKDWEKYDLKKIGNEYISNIKEYSNNKNYVTDKMPHNFWYIGLIKLILPNAKIIHCKRDPKDTCFSIFKNCFSGAIDYGYNLDELIEYYNEYLDLMNHWENCLPEFIYNISYEKLIKDQINETKKLIKACNLDWDEKCLEHSKNPKLILTLSTNQARKRIYDSSIEKWKNYEEYLKTKFVNLRI